MSYSNVFQLPQNPPGYTGYQSLLKKKQGTERPTPLVTKPVFTESVTAKPASGVVSSTKPSSPGSYKGVPINAGTDADVQAQLRAIDTPYTPPQIKKGLVDRKTRDYTKYKEMKEEDTSSKDITYGGLVGSLAERSGGPSEDVTKARDMAYDINAKLEAFRRSVADTTRGIYDEPTSAAVMQGRAQAIQLANAQKEAALASQFEGATNLYGQALTGQGQLLGALGTAAGLAQPSPAQFGQTVFNPLTGRYESQGGAGNLDPQTQASTFAQQIMSGGMTYDQAISSMGYAGQAGKTFLDNAIIQAGGNPLQLQAQGAGQQGILTNIPNLVAADTAAKGIKNQIVAYLQSKPNLNVSKLAAGNLLQQWIQGKQLADPEYQTLFNYLNEYTNTLAPILGVGGDPTNLKTQIAQSFINAAASGQSIIQVLDSMSALAENKIQDYRSGATGGGVVSTPNFSSGAVNEGWGWNP